MGFWKKQRGLPWQKKSAGENRSIEEVWSMLLGQAASKAGIAVNWKTALQYSTAQACVRIISEDIAQLPFGVYRSLPGGGNEQVTDHPVHKLLKIKPNSEQSAFEMREQMGLHAVLTNNGYAWKNIVRGAVQELLPFEPHQVRPVRKNGETSYVLTLEGGKQETVPKNEIWHLRGPSWNGYQGIDGIRLLRETVGLALAMEDHGSRLFSNGATVGGVLSTEANLNPDQAKALRESWESRQSGGENAYKTAVMWGGMKWTPMAQQNDHAQFLESRRFQVEETCRYWNIPPVMVGHSDKTTTYASAEQMVLIYLRQCLGPWLTRIEQSANCNLLTDDEIAAGYFCKFTRNAMLAMTATDRSNFYRTMYGIGAINPNEIRELEDMNPYEGGGQYRVPLNMTDPANPTDGNTDNANPV
jgi:HK97 family phage portal protein